jgi:2'-5' RNA ligase
MREARMRKEAPGHRLYFALRPDEAAARRIVRLTEGLRRAHGLAAQAMAMPRLHVSLAFVREGEAPPAPDLVARALTAAGTIDLVAFRLAFNRLVSWKHTGGNRPLVLTGDEGVIGVDRLREALQDALAAASLVPSDGKDREAHLTVLWGDHQVDEWLREPLAWTVREVVLLDSVYGERRQDLLGRVPLRPAPLPARRDARPDPRRSAAR